MAQTKARAARAGIPTKLDDAVDELKDLLDLPTEKREPSWANRVRRLHDHVRKCMPTAERLDGEFSLGGAVQRATRS